MITTIPFFSISGLAFEFINSREMLIVILALPFLSIGVTFNSTRSPRFLKYVTLVTVSILVMIFGLLLSQIVLWALERGDFTFETPASLGHPQDNIPLDQALIIDMQDLGLDWVGTMTVAQVNNVKLAPSADAVQVVYEGRKSAAVITLIKFDARQEVVRFYTAWRDGAANFRIFEFELNPPGPPDQGHIMRYYDPQMEIAYSAWQDDKWVTIIEVQGPFPTALSLSKEIKALVANDYLSSE
jgi:hypothetical protein